MTYSTFYRLAVWLPLVVPALVAVIVHGIGVAVGTGALSKMVQVLLGSLLYGGIPYGVLAAWATWWIGSRPEPEVRRLMFRSPLLMVAVFVPMAILTGVIGGAPVPFLAVAALGAIIIIPLGYTYVAFVMWLRGMGDLWRGTVYEASADHDVDPAGPWRPAD